MTSKAAHNSLWQTSDAIFGLGLLIAVAFEVLFPRSLAAVFPRLALLGVGAVAVLAGGRIFMLAKQAMRRQGQPAQPGQPTTALLTEGIFARSRNPMYLGLVIIFIGLGLLFDFVWLLLALIPIIITVHIVLIAPEERYLAEKFGPAYTHYAAKVRRWL